MRLDLTERNALNKALAGIKAENVFLLAMIWAFIKEAGEKAR